MNVNLHDKTVLITGGSRGIGKTTAITLAKFGARIILQYNSNKTSAKEIIDMLPQVKDGHLAVKADFNMPDSIDKFVADVLKKTKRIDVLVNNAGVYIEKTFSSLDIDEWKETWNRTISVNLTSVAHLSFIIAKHMQKQGGGKIINISSRGAFRGEPDALAYGASKAGLNSLGQSMAKALGPDNIFVYTLAPGFVNTDMAINALSRPEGKDILAQSPLNRIAEPDEIAKTIAFLADEGSEYLTGSIIDINGASYLRS